jgi:hypothetical protein
VKSNKGWAMSRFIVFAAVVLGGTAAVAAADQPGSVSGQIENYHNVNYVVVSPNGPRDGGDFGPHTPGTKTSGIQEALSFAKEHVRDVYICGGGIKAPFQGGVGYTLHETLHIPWNQNWRLDGGEYWLSYGGTAGKPYAKQCLETHAGLPVPDLGETQHATRFERRKQYRRPLKGCPPLVAAPSVTGCGVRLCHRDLCCCGLRSWKSWFFVERDWQSPTFRTLCSSYRTVWPEIRL